MRKPGSASGSPTRAAPGAGSSVRHGQAPGLPEAFEVSLGRAAAIAVGVIVAIAIAYGIGVKRGQSLGPGAPAPAASVSGDAPAGSGAPGEGSVGVAAKSAGPAIPSRGAAPAPPSVVTDNGGDPRVKGMRYFVLAHPSSERAPEMVEFCRQNGLDAYLVPDNNALLRKVIVLPGYREPSQRSSPEIKALEAKIKTVGQKYRKASPRNSTDFSDAFPELFK
jgi:hypothetical protein